jgi:hypothetical protein
MPSMKKKKYTGKCAFELSRLRKKKIPFLILQIFFPFEGFGLNSQSDILFLCKIVFFLHAEVASFVQVGFFFKYTVDL